MSIRNARRLWEKQKSKFAVVRKTRTAVLGDGKGTTDDNINVPNSPEYVWARDTAESKAFYPLLNRTGVPLVHDMPVLVGYTDEEPDTEQVLRIFTEGLGPTAIATVPTTSAHKQQHEFGGGDVPDIDGRMFLPGRVSPTSPASMQVKIQSFVYYYNGWRKFNGATSDSLTRFVPASGYKVYVMIALDPGTGSLVYRPGLPYAVGSAQDIFPTFEDVPSPSGDEYPLGWVLLESTTTSVDWTTSSDNIGDARLHIGFPARNILDRLTQLESLSGNDPNIALTGAALNSSDGYTHTLGNLLDVAVGGATDGKALIYEQATNRWVPSTVAAGGLSLYGLGASDVSGASAVGISASAAPGDHVHRGIQSANVPGNAKLFGSIYIESGTGTTVTQSGNSVVISASGTGGTISGSGVADRIAFWSGASILSNDPGLTYNATDNNLFTDGLGLGLQTGTIDKGVFALWDDTASYAQIWAGNYFSGTRTELQMVAGNFTFSVAGNQSLAIPVGSGIRVGGFTDMSSASTPGAPAAGYGRLYVRADGMLCYKNVAGSETVLGSGGEVGPAVSSIMVTGASPLQGNVFLVPGAGASLSQSGTSITIAATGTANAVSSIGVNGAVPLGGVVTLVQGTGASLSQSGGSITIAATGGATKVFGGRLTYDGDNPIPSTDITDASVLYYLPYLDDSVSLYTSSSAWSNTTFTAPSLALAGLSPNSVYDVFGFLNGTELTLETARWNVNNIARVTGLSAQNGIQVSSTNKTRVLLGSIYMGSTSGVTADSDASRFVSNYYNRIPRTVGASEPTISWVYSIDAWRALNNNTANRVQMVFSDQVLIDVSGYGHARPNNAGVIGQIGLGQDTTTANCAIPGVIGEGTSGGRIRAQLYARLIKYAPLGFHFFQAVEKSSGTSTSYFSADPAGAYMGGVTGIIQA